MPPYPMMFLRAHGAQAPRLPSSTPLQAEDPGGVLVEKLLLRALAQSQAIHLAQGLLMLQQGIVRAPHHLVLAVRVDELHELGLPVFGRMSRSSQEQVGML